MARLLVPIHRVVRSGLMIAALSGLASAQLSLNDVMATLADLGVESACAEVADLPVATDLCRDTVNVAEADRAIDELLAGYDLQLSQLTVLQLQFQALPESVPERVAALAELDAEVTAQALALFDRSRRFSERIEGRRFLLDNAELLGRFGASFPPEMLAAIEFLRGDVAHATVQGWIARQGDMIATLVALEDLRQAIGEARDAATPTGGFSGVWSSSFGGVMVLRWEGERVTGSYGENGGRVLLEVVGARRLDGVWVEEGPYRDCGSEVEGSNHWGRLVLEFDEPFSSYGGTWSWCSDQVSGDLTEWAGSFVRPLGKEE